jgi:hypothetical protein
MNRENFTKSYHIENQSVILSPGDRGDEKRGNKKSSVNPRCPLKSMD